MGAMAFPSSRSSFQASDDRRDRGVSRRQRSQLLNGTADDLTRGIEILTTISRECDGPGLLGKHPSATVAARHSTRSASR
jgi:hypothetical protein